MKELTYDGNYHCGFCDKVFRVADRVQFIKHLEVCRKKKNNLNKKLAKFVGLKNPKFDSGGITYEGTIGKNEYPNLFIDYFTDSIDSCFLILIPAIQKKWKNWKSILHDWIDLTDVTAESLCILIEKVIDSDE